MSSDAAELPPSQNASPTSAALTTNPFCTRFVRPGAIDFRFTLSNESTSDRECLSSLSKQVASYRRTAIVGPHGTGKSTLIESLLPELKQHFSQIGFVQLNGQPVAAAKTIATRWVETFRRWRLNHRLVNEQQAELTDHDFGFGTSDIRSQTLLIIDGLEQLPLLGRRQIVKSIDRRNQSLLVTSHRCERTFKTIYQTQVDPAILKELTRRLVAESDPATRQAIERELGSRDLGRVQNVRDFWFELYDVVSAKR